MQVSEYVGNASKVLVMLGSSIDSREVKHHLNAFHRFVSEDSYLIVQDTFHGNAVVATKAFLSERKVSTHCPCPRTRCTTLVCTTYRSREARVLGGGGVTSPATARTTHKQSRLPLAPGWGEDCWAARRRVVGAGREVTCIDRGRFWSLRAIGSPTSSASFCW